MRPPRLLPLLAVCCALACAPGSGAPPWSPGQPRQSVPVGGSPQRGPADAAVTLIEFGDFFCHYCADSVPDLERLLREHPTELRQVFKHLPFVAGAASRAAAAGAAAAQRQGRFWEMHDRLFAARDQAPTDEHLLAHARALGLDLERFLADLHSPEVAAQIDADVAEADRLGVQGTPAFFVNGLRLRGAQSYEALAAVVEREVERARAPAAP